MLKITEGQTKKCLIICLVLVGLSVYIIDTPELISTSTFVDDNNLHATHMSENVTDELDIALQTFTGYLKKDKNEKREHLKEFMENLGFETYDYHDKLDAKGFLAVLRPRRTDDRTSLLVIGRYSTNNSSPLNPQQMPAMNTLSSMLAIALKLSKQEWIGKNVIMLFLEDGKTGIHDFFNWYDEHPFCGRIIAGFSLNIQPSNYGSTSFRLVVGTNPLQSNQDILNGIAFNIKAHYSNFEIDFKDKHAESIEENMLLSASTIRYTECTEGPKHNVDMIEIQTLFDTKEQSKSIPHKYLLKTYFTTLRMLNNLYQQLQYSTYFYIMTDAYKYIQYPFIILLSG